MLESFRNVILLYYSKNVLLLKQLTEISRQEVRVWYRHTVVIDLFDLCKNVKEASYTAIFFFNNKYWLEICFGIWNWVIFILWGVLSCQMFETTHCIMSTLLAPPAKYYHMTNYIKWHILFLFFHAQKEQHWWLISTYMFCRKKHRDIVSIGFKL